MKAIGRDRTHSEFLIARQYAKYGPVPAGDAWPSSPVNTVLPKKNGSPQSKVPELVPPIVGSTFSWFGMLSALSILQVTAVFVPFAPMLFAFSVTEEDGQ